MFDSDSSKAMRVIQALGADIITRAEARKILGVDKYLKTLDKGPVKDEESGPALPTTDQSVIRVFPKDAPDASVILIYHAQKNAWRYNSGVEADPLRPHEDFEVIYDAGVTSDRNNNEEK